MLGDLIFSGVLALLAFVGWFRYRRNVRRATRRRPAELSDHLIRQIETRGRIHYDPDEPLDLKRIREEEERFWKARAWEDELERL